MCVSGPVISALILKSLGKTFNFCFGLFYFTNGEIKSQTAWKWSVWKTGLLSIILPSAMWYSIAVVRQNLHPWPLTLGLARWNHISLMGTWKLSGPCMVGIHLFAFGDSLWEKHALGSCWSKESKATHGADLKLICSLELSPPIPDWKQPSYSWPMDLCIRKQMFDAVCSGKLGSYAAITN